MPTPPAPPSSDPASTPEREASVPRPTLPDIPVLDLATVGADELVEALVGSSCVFLTGHAFDDAHRSALLATSIEFFDSPEADKAQVQWSGELPWRGWQPVHSAGSGRILLERFEISFTPGGPPPDADGHPSIERWGDTFDQWPARPDSFRRVWTEAYARLHETASAVTRLIARGTGAAEADLAAWTTGHHANLVVHHYLAQTEAPDPGELRYQPHTDIGGVTLLWADDAPGGLEAQLGPDGGWVPVAHPEGALLVQAGDLLHLWSRRRIPANLHRVANPPQGPTVRQRARWSIAYFHHPDLDTWVAPSDDGKDGEAAEGVGAREHVLERQRQLAQAQTPRSS